MKSEGLAFFTDTYLVTGALLLFFSTFIILLVMHLRNYKGEKIDKMTRLPFEGDEHGSKV